MIKIRKYKEEDNKQVKRLVTEVIMELYHQKPKHIQDLNNIKKNYISYIVAENNKKIIGIVSLQKKDNKTAKLRRLYINKKFRRKGLGQKLLKEIESIAKKLKFKYIVLNTKHKNEIALNLYQKNNYKDYKKIKSRVYLKKDI
ncbi:MAG: GNAT family N-acetyltransferase [Candidatus Pacearchaeota archaeon]|jgi:ribosomal protein S18 acetylase RimI-like enzyme